MKKLVVILLCSTFFFLESCKDDDDDKCTKEVPEDKLTVVDQTRLKSDSLAIVEYLATNSITGTEIKDNVRYLIAELGTGETPCLESFLKVKYRGTLMKTGYIFDPDQLRQPDVDWQEREVSFNTNDSRLNRLILGWQIVLPSMPVGSKFTMYIPSGYGYGANGGPGGSVPSNANLIFEIELIAVN